MGRQQKLNLQEDEALAEAVRRFPCLYDKCSPHYKDKRKVENSWNAVTIDLGYEEGMFLFSYYSIAAIILLKYASIILF